MSRILSYTTNIAGGVDITTLLNIATWANTTGKDLAVRVAVGLEGLNGAAADITFNIKYAYTKGCNTPVFTETKTKTVTADTKLSWQCKYPIIVGGDTITNTNLQGIIVSVVSTNASDTAVTFFVMIEDVNGAQVVSEFADAQVNTNGYLNVNVKEVGDETPKDDAALEAIVVAAFLAATGFTPGGTWTVADLLKVIAARMAGNVQDKVEGDPTVKQVLDPDDGETVVLEVTGSLSSPQIQIEVL